MRLIDPLAWKLEVIRPALLWVDKWSPSAENLLLGTALVESNLEYLRQMGDGPALGPYQMEPATHKSLWEDYLAYRPDLSKRILEAISAAPGTPPELHARLLPRLVGDMTLDRIEKVWWYATLLARCRYLWDRHPLPNSDNALGLARYWKRVYNTHLGAGSVEKALPQFELVVSLEPRA